MANIFKSTSELQHCLENMINTALDSTVKDGIVDALKINALDVVYGAYTPNKYDRRYSLTDDSNYNVDKSDNMKLKITPIAKFNPNASLYNPKSHSYVPYSSRNGYGDELAGLINYGDGWNGYQYEFVTEEEEENPTYTAPRPFIDYTREDLADSGFKTLLQAGLEELGITIK